MIVIHIQYRKDYNKDDKELEGKGLTGKEINENCSNTLVEKEKEIGQQGSRVDSMVEDSQRRKFGKQVGK